MIFKETNLKGAYIVEIEQNKDERGFFARSFCEKEFQQQGIDFKVVQCSVSFSKNRGTLRGMHYQSAPYEEAKLVSCTKGKIYDVIIDLRKGSTTYCQWHALELSDEDYKILYVPKGFAHGFQALEDNTEVFYQISEFYHPETACSVRWNDHNFNISWPIPITLISEKDKNCKDFSW